MKLIKNLIFICLVALFSLTLSGAQKKPGIVKIEGKLLNFGTSVELEEFSELQYLLPKSLNRIITIDKDSLFTISFPLNSPGYFRLGRNKLYLSPGDNLRVVIDNNNSQKSEFSGKGSEANNYLRKTPFPKGGSYLEAGKNIQPTPSEMLASILNKAKERENELAIVKGVSTEFVRLEKARIKADVIMSISKVFGYSGIVFNKKTKEFVQSYINDFKELSKPVKDSILNGFVDPTYLQIEVYRDIYNELNLKDGVKPREMQVMKDWKKASLLGYGKISPLSDKSKIPSLRMTVDSIKTKKYREPLHLMLDEKMKFGTGDPAIDLTFITPEGTNANLSSLKGKVIYIDIWATWCGPCMAEMPQLETLKEKYAKNNNVSIVSLSVDDTDSIWLRDLEKRNPGGIQFRIERAKLSDYEVLLIPRFILIDKNFNIANMYAPAPSNTELPKIIDNLISK